MHRRDFLKLGAYAVSGLILPHWEHVLGDNPPRKTPHPRYLGRVAWKSVPFHVEPDDKSKILGRLERDSLIDIYETITSQATPVENSRWYRLSQGYIHSAHIQRVEKSHFNQPLKEINEDGILAEITVPYSQTMYKTRKGKWINLYRLYFGSVHWVTGIFDEEESGKRWYCLTDEWLRIQYYAPASHLRPIPPDELAPISPEITAKEKRIEVSIQDQKVTAFEMNRQVFSAPASTGKRYMETPLGEFNINRKCPSKHMGNGAITGDIHAYELVGVPWVSFFYSSGTAFHGTFWHDNFGTPMSRGCVNMRNNDAKWLFRWTQPSYNPLENYRSGRRILGAGAKVVVI